MSERLLPQAGYYIFNEVKFDVEETHRMGFKRRSVRRPGQAEPSAPNLENVDEIHVVYASGADDGNYFWDPDHFGRRWRQLPWLCQDLINEMQTIYDYSDVNPTGVDLPKRSSKMKK